jgi:hypothetical protein
MDRGRAGASIKTEPPEEPPPSANRPSSLAAELIDDSMNFEFALVV